MVGAGVGDGLAYNERCPRPWGVFAGAGAAALQVQRAAVGGWVGAPAFCQPVPSRVDGPVDVGLDRPLVDDGAALDALPGYPQHRRDHARVAAPRPPWPRVSVLVAASVDK